jgi:hypothetical protein
LFFFFKKKKGHKKKNSAESLLAPTGSGMTRAAPA